MLWAGDGGGSGSGLSGDLLFSPCGAVFICLTMFFWFHPFLLLLLFYFSLGSVCLPVFFFLFYHQPHSSSCLSGQRHPPVVVVVVRLCSYHKNSCTTVTSVSLDAEHVSNSDDFEGGEKNNLSFCSPSLSPWRAMPSISTSTTSSQKESLFKIIRNRKWGKERDTSISVFISSFLYERSTSASFLLMP